MDLLVIIIDVCSILSYLLFLYTYPHCPCTLYTKKPLAHYIVTIITNKCFRITRYKRNSVTVMCGLELKVLCSNSEQTH